MPSPSSAGALAHILAAGVLAGPGILTAGLADALIDAVRLDDRAAVASLLTQGADVNAREADGATALAWAAMRSNTGIAELLLDAGANPDPDQCAWGRSAFISDSERFGGHGASVARQRRRSERSARERRDAFDDGGAHGPG